MMIEKEEVIKRLSSLGYEVVEEDDFLIDFLIQSVYQTLLNETNTDEIPDGLRYVAINMICGKLLINKLATDKIEIEKAISSIREGDTSVTYSVGSDPKQFLNDYYQKLTTPISEIVKYRRLSW